MTGDTITKCNQLSNFFTVKSSREKDKEVAIELDKVQKDEDDVFYYLKVSDMLALDGWYNESYVYYLKAKNSLQNLQKWNLTVSSIS